MVQSIFNIDFLLLGIAIAGNLILGFVVFFNQKKSTTNKLLFVFTIINSIWSLVTYLSYTVTDKQLALWLVRLVMFFATVHGSMFLFLVNAFPGEKLRMKKKYAYTISSLVILTMVLSLTPFLFSDIDFISGRVPQPKPAPGIVVFIFVTISAIVSGIFSLIKRTIKSSGTEKNQYKYLLIGAIIMFASILSLDFLLPSFFNDTRFIPLSALFTLPFVVSVSYAIIRHRLFNVRVVGTALLVFALSIVSFIEVTQTESFVLILYRSTVLFFILVFGILLIRSVLREVKQREKMEKMAADIRKAYEIEKKALIAAKKAKEELENLDVTKNQFLLTIQHHLRTPLTAMMGYADLLVNGAFGKQSKKTLDVIKKFQFSTSSLIKMVNEFLDITQFQLGKSVVLLKPGVDLTLLLDEIVSELEFNAEKKGIYLKLEKPEPARNASGQPAGFRPAMPVGIADAGGKTITINADKEKLRAALSNIFDNAIKYTLKGGVIIKMQNANIKNQNDESDSILIIVKDTGIGISQEKIQNLFNKPFERGEQAKTFAIGSGIGLYLSSAIIKSHNGKIWAESKGENQGTTFYIELPIS